MSQAFSRANRKNTALHKNKKQKIKSKKQAHSESHTKIRRKSKSIDSQR